MDVVYQENMLTADDYCTFQRKMGWQADPKGQVAKSLANSLFSVTAMRGNEIIGMGRLVGDAAMYWYAQDVFVLTEHQSKGIGTEIVKRLIRYVKQNSLPGTSVSLGLMSAQDREGFYERIGFQCRPRAGEGAGMEMVIEIQ